MKQFAFVNDAAEREYKALSKDVQQEFGTIAVAITGADILGVP